ncbi:hypothetical protein VE03_09648 [Pseudogymnoascus sp. 23342-1-I1]|nr:hypothetical protein VE03_09648 [Pseudogymnoascus sp. 23342-1-I1]
MAPPPLPEELLVRICSYLCFHCQNPDDFPNADEPCPILYHYYSTGNLLGPINRMVSDYPTADDMLPAFLCAIIRQPFLATHVRSLQLQETRSPNFPSFAPEKLTLLHSTSNTYGVRTPTCVQWIIDPTLPCPIVNEKKIRTRLHLWLRELAIVLTPRIEKLMYGRSPFRPMPMEMSYRVMPGLTSIAFRNGIEGFGISMMPPLVKMAPNLVSLHATDATDTMDSWGDSILRNVNAAPVLPHVRRLVGEGLRIDTFGALKRFCYMFISGRLTSYSDVCAPYERLLPKNRFQTIESLQGFCQLEELVIDQWAFYSDEYGYGDMLRLVTLLPASIQSVHFRYVYKSMEAELRRLAVAVPDSFPNLRHLKVNIAENCRPERRQGLVQMRSVEADFADVGVLWLRNPQQRPPLPAPLPSTQKTDVDGAE